MSLRSLTRRDNPLPLTKYRQDGSPFAVFERGILRSIPLSFRSMAQISFRRKGSGLRAVSHNERDPVIFQFPNKLLNLVYSEIF